MTELSTHTRTELAHRSSDGMDVTLVWMQDDGKDKTVVCVCDGREGVYFEIPAQPHFAIDVYYHPFADRHFCTANYDSRLAA